jgi:hypothetical protein
MFSPCKPFQPSLTSVGNARAYPSETPFRFKKVLQHWPEVQIILDNLEQQRTNSRLKLEKKRFASDVTSDVTSDVIKPYKTGETSDAKSGKLESRLN